ncbi:MAG TPA: polyphosphate kinase 1 [Candidatus Acidoferrum sp.]|nr:polyphosphate kinase 1 [Candidatus Acidoferrum sp.]
MNSSAQLEPESHEPESGKPKRESAGGAAKASRDSGARATGEVAEARGDVDAPAASKSSGDEAVPTGAKAPRMAGEEPSDAPAVALDSPSLYINRELSLLEFQRRVLEQAQSTENPLLERIKFLSIVSSNLDEFFMVRVSGLQKQAASGTQEASVDGLAPATQLRLIREQVRALVGDMQDLLRETLLPALRQEGIRVCEISELTEDERAEIDSYFLQSVFPVLTPLAFDPGRPFPHISSGSLNLAVVVGDGQGVENFARVKLPDSLPRLVPVPPNPQASKGPKALKDTTGKVSTEKTQAKFVWLEQVIAGNLHLLFPGMEILEAYPFRVTRDAEVAIQELESDDLLESVEEAMRQRQFNSVVRLQVDVNVSERTLEVLASNLPIDKEDVYRIEGNIGLAKLMELYALDRPDLKDKPFVPTTPPSLEGGAEEDIFSVIRREDVLLHHPYESFQPVIDFLQAAARDPDVLAIKMTLYRVGRNSPIVGALLEAVEEGKQVAALVELKARFDEESNIEWARTLEDAGVHVVYGLAQMKVHSKIALVVRREGNGIRRYVHMATGNYNATTARLYTDFGFFTCNDAIADDATYFFNALTGYSRKKETHHLLVAPINLRRRVEELIEREIAVHEKEGHGRLIFKMNALEDPEMIRLLYRASQAGVKIDLLVRGLCCLRPGVKGVSENIRVTSIVGRFLEHSRIYYFRNGGAEEIYLGSADLMRRNLSHRVETLFPVADPKLVRRLKAIVHLELEDVKRSHHLASSGHYVRRRTGDQADAADSQLELLTREDTPHQVAKGLASLSRKRRAAERKSGGRRTG